MIKLELRYFHSKAISSAVSNPGQIVNTKLTFMNNIDNKFSGLKITDYYFLKSFIVISFQ